MKVSRILICNRHKHQTISHRSLKKNIEQILEHLDLGDASVEVTLVDDHFMRAQNSKHMQKSGTTDVLSFPQLSPQKSRMRYCKKFLGDILISLDQAKRQAKEQGITLANEVLFLTVHSILHLIGFDHGTKKEQLKMQKLESKIWLEIMRNSV